MPWRLASRDPVDIAVLLDPTRPIASVLEDIRNLEEGEPLVNLCIKCCFAGQAKMRDAVQSDLRMTPMICDVLILQNLPNTISSQVSSQMYTLHVVLADVKQKPYQTALHFATALSKHRCDCNCMLPDKAAEITSLFFMICSGNWST